MPEPDPITLLIADDHPMLREGVRAVVERQPDLVVIGEAASVAETLSLLEPGRPLPSVLLTDITFGGRSGLELIRDVRALHPSLPILVLSMHDEAIYGERALGAGARGYVMKQAGSARLIDAIRRVHAGEVVVSPALNQRLLLQSTGRRQDNAIHPVAGLSAREFEVFTLAGKGFDGPAIALQLNLSVKTVDVHRMKIRRKLGLKNASELAQFAIQWTVSEHADATPDSGG
jgi:DNA-binding NarL/FixJ family response regulator